MFKPLNKAPGELLRKPNWTRESLLPFKKDFYTPHVDTVNRLVLYFLLITAFFYLLTREFFLGVKMK